MPEIGGEELGVLQRAGAERGALVAITIAPLDPASGAVAGLGLALAGSDLMLPIDATEPVAVVARIDGALQPRWVMWSGETALVLARAGVRLTRSWDLAAVHRLLVGRWKADPARVWAWAGDLPQSTIPVASPVDLFHQPLVDADDQRDLDPVGPDGHLRASWVDGGWSTSPGHLAAWAAAAATVAERQIVAVQGLAEPTVERTNRSGEGRSAGGGPHVGARGSRPMAPATARAESTAELLCAELAVDGLPMDRQEAERLVTGFVGLRPRSTAEAEELQRARQAEVLRHAPAGAAFDLRSPAQVKALLAVVGLDVPDTRAWRLESLAEAHPVVRPLLDWRRAERIGTTYGYGWLDEHLGDDGRLRGSWSASDGAAGRMTASAGLHNMPAVMRSAVVAEPGHVFVRADLGQIEPRVLAAVSGDESLAGATVGDDLYAPVAAQLGVDRATAKVAVLGAMYGQTTGHGARALRGLHSAFPVAMAYLDAADHAAQRGDDLRTYGGRLVRMGAAPLGPGPVTGDFEAEPGSARDARSRAAARGRYGRNAMVQGAAAELFKVWAVTVRARVASLGARIVLCLHDELLVHAPAGHGDEVAELVVHALGEAAHRWAPDDAVRFVADVSVIPRWSDAKL
jgi:DNA polymerase-1